MNKKAAATFLALGAVGALVACSGRYGTSAQSQSVELPSIDRDLTVTAILPKDTIGAGYPPQLGHVKSPFWKATVGGFTQTKFSQILGFPPNTKITIKNVSGSGEDHTLNVIQKIAGPPAKFPPNPNLPFTPSGGQELKAGYRSGTIHPGKSVTVTLIAGTYLIGCAYHYLSDGMRDVLVVKVGAKPGPTATPPS
jgi:hypothetical protein